MLVKLEQIFEKYSTMKIRSHCGPGFDSASNRNFLERRGLKAAVTQGWQPYHLHVPIVMKSGRLNLLEPSGPVQSCTGITLPLFFSNGEGLCLLRGTDW